MAEAPRFHARRSGQTFGRYEGYHPKLGTWDHITSRRNRFCLSGVRAPLEATTRLGPPPSCCGSLPATLIARADEVFERRCSLLQCMSPLMGTTRTSRDI